jgi:hypothetical protein
LEAEQQKETKNKFVADVLKLLLEVSFYQFPSVHAVGMAVRPPSSPWDT